MRILPVILVLLAGAAVPPTVEVVEGGRIEKGRLVTKAGSRPIDPARVSGEHLKRLPPGGPWAAEVVRRKKGPVVVGLWPLSMKTEPKDLELTLKLTGPARVKASENPQYEIRLVNKSKTTAHRVVLPNDGSESGWREPRIRWSGTAAGRELEKRPIGRCGMYAEDWHRDVVVIPPGRSLDLTSRYLPPRICLGLPAKGKVKLVAHYEYGAAKGLEDRAAKGTGPMGKTPAFQLASKPVEIEIAGP